MGRGHVGHYRVLSNHLLPVHGEKVPEGRMRGDGAGKDEVAIADRVRITRFNMENGNNTDSGLPSTALGTRSLFAGSGRFLHSVVSARSRGIRLHLGF